MEMRKSSLFPAQDLDLDQQKPRYDHSRGLLRISSMTINANGASTENVLVKVLAHLVESSKQ